MEKLRGGVFGCGMISEFHLRGWRRIPEVEIVALGNRTLSRAVARRDEFAPGARVYADLETMLREERLDFVDILSVPWLHREHCLRARDAGVHIICQKPLCDTLDDARALIQAMTGYPRLFAVHENHPYRPWFHTVLTGHREGTFGTIRLLRLAQYDAKEPPEAYKNEAARGVLLEYGTHLVDMVLTLLGLPTRVYARLSHGNPRMRGEHLALVVFEYPEATAVVDIAWKPGGPPHGGFTLEGDMGTVLYEGTMTRGAMARFRMTQGDTMVVDETRSPYDDYVESFFRFERECVDCMLTGKPATQSGARNFETLAATFAAYRAAETGRLVEVAPFLATGAERESPRDCGKSGNPGVLSEEERV
jgi:predicted dehydrogenase